MFLASSFFAPTCYPFLINWVERPLLILPPLLRLPPLATLLTLELRRCREAHHPPCPWPLHRSLWDAMGSDVDAGAATPESDVVDDATVALIMLPRSPCSKLMHSESTIQCISNVCLIKLGTRQKGAQHALIHQDHRLV